MRPEPVLTASENLPISNSAPAHGFYSVLEQPEMRRGVRNMQHGAREHRQIATHATRARTLHRAQRLWVLVIVALLAAVLLQQLIENGLIKP
jgi:hypothetical protein